MADSFSDGCYDPKKPSPDQLYPLLYKTSAAVEITLRQLHFYGTKTAPWNTSLRGIPKSSYLVCLFTESDPAGTSSCDEEDGRSESQHGTEDVEDRCADAACVRERCAWSVADGESCIYFIMC